MKPKKTASKTPDAKTALEKFFADELNDVYWAEKRLEEILPAMHAAANSKKLIRTLAEYQQFVKSHIQKLEQIFELLNVKPQIRKNDAFEGIAAEGEIDIRNTPGATTERDLGIILTSKKIVSFKITAYGTLVRLAKSLGLTNIAGLLATILIEENETDQDLADFSEKEIRPKGGSKN
jgi:ferritin-like metal-binding protein YciE